MVSLKYRGGIETTKKTKVILADLTPVFGSRKWPPRAFHHFSNVVIVAPDGRIYLSKAQDREQFTPYGGEWEYAKAEQSKEAAAREVIEETGRRVNPDPTELILIDSVAVYPTKEYDPYGGVILNIDTFIYFLKDTDKSPMTSAQEHEEGCRIEKIVCLFTEDILHYISCGEIKVYPNFIETLRKVKIFLEKYQES